MLRRRCKAHKQPWCPHVIKTNCQELPKQQVQSIHYCFGHHIILRCSLVEWDKFGWGTNCPMGWISIFSHFAPIRQDLTNFRHAPVDIFLSVTGRREKKENKTNEKEREEQKSACSGQIKKNQSRKREEEWGKICVLVSQPVRRQSCSRHLGTQETGNKRCSSSIGRGQSNKNGSFWWTVKKTNLFAGKCSLWSNALLRY